MKDTPTTEQIRQQWTWNYPDYDNDVEHFDAWLAEYTRVKQAEARAERDSALAAVERVRAIHAPEKIIDVWGKSRSQADDFLVCVECTDPDNWWIAYPCATVAATVRR